MSKQCYEALWKNFHIWSTDTINQAGRMSKTKFTKQKIQLHLELKWCIMAKQCYISFGCFRTVWKYSQTTYTFHRQTRALSVSSKVFHGTTRGKVRHRFGMEDGNKFLSGIAQTFLWVTLSLRRSCSGRSNGTSPFQQLKTKTASFSIVLWSEITPRGLRRVTSPCFPSNLKDCRLINHNPQVTTTTQDCSVTFFVLDLKPADPRRLGTSRHL